MQNVRLHFSKLFDARYISHLDVQRCFSRALKKSGLDVWYTEGFNTHIYLTFALPLSLGVESICDTADIRLVNDDFDSSLVDAINPNLPYGLEVFNADIAHRKTNEIAWARYLVEMCDATISSEALCAAATAVFSQEEILTEKRAKRTGVQTINIKPLIGGWSAGSSGGMCRLELLLAAGSERSLNPATALAPVVDKLGFYPEHCLVKRVQILTRDMYNFE
ncbi:MAG: TIGR03936 family radical SAM-associated protein [Oscillospiraceae bacterium]|nr:TIGR03936 family radical SAM-associated protein [Oscillospiraceae bacterium]